MRAEYQLVIQFSAKSLSDFDELVALEEKLSECLATGAEVDGHDFGAGEFNVYIRTSDPQRTFGRALLVIQAQCSSFRAHYRKLDSEEEFLLWPIS